MSEYIQQFLDEKYTPDGICNLFLRPEFSAIFCADLLEIGEEATWDSIIHIWEWVDLERDE